MSGNGRADVRIIDRLLAREVVKFVLLALASVVVIYLLIDLFEELNYFTTRKVGFLVILLYYLYMLPSAVTLLYPVSLLLAVFVVYGQLTRNRELHALESAGVRAMRLFVPTVGIGLATVIIYLVGYEFVAVPANAGLADLRAYRIERRQVQATQKRRDVYFVGEAGRVFNIREFESNGVMSGFSIQELGSDRRVRRRLDGRQAFFRDGRWVAYGVTVREFTPDGFEQLSYKDSMVLEGVMDKPADFERIWRPVEETSAGALREYIRRMRRAGEDTAEEEVEYHYRFSYSLIGLVVVLLGLPLSVRLRKGGVMFGLGLGLLISFLYWGAIQMSRAYGSSHMVSPALAAWLPNIVFGGIAVGLIVQMKQ
jgi:lipopolysaccharide export system permease protein